MSDKSTTNHFCRDHVIAFFDEADFVKELSCYGPAVMYSHAGYAMERVIIKMLFF